MATRHLCCDAGHSEMLLHNCFFFLFLAFFLQRLISVQGRSVDRHQILTRVRRWPGFIKLGQKFEPLPKNLTAWNIQICDKFWTTSKLDRKYLLNETRCHRTENGVANCNLSCACSYNLVNFGTQTAKNRTGVSLRGSRFVVRTSLSLSVHRVKLRPTP